MLPTKVTTPQEAMAWAEWATKDNRPNLAGAFAGLANYLQEGLPKGPKWFMNEQQKARSHGFNLQKKAIEEYCNTAGIDCPEIG